MSLKLASIVIFDSIYQFKKGRTLPAKWNTQKFSFFVREMEEKSCGMRSGNNDTPCGSCQPPTYTDEQIIRIPEITCRKPEEYGYETIHWSLNQLMDVVIKEGIVKSISRNIGLKNIGKFRPHLVRYWVHSFESAEDPEMLAEKVNEIFTIYYDV
jgi:hypothetical protein